MADVVDAQTRSRMMAGIRGRETQPEIVLRRALHARGIRYRLHDKRLPGRPDLVFPKYTAVCLVHGCFWHRHKGCRYTTTPATRPEFWRNKFAENVARDKRNELALKAAGWRVATVWECALKRHPASEVARWIGLWLRGTQSTFNSDQKA